MKKKLVLFGGKIVYCILPAFLLVAAVWSFYKADIPASSGGNVPPYSVFEIIQELLEG